MQAEPDNSSDHLRALAERAQSILHQAGALTDARRYLIEDLKRRQHHLPYGYITVDVPFETRALPGVLSRLSTWDALPQHVISEITDLSRNTPGLLQAARPLKGLHKFFASSSKREHQLRAAEKVKEVVERHGPFLWGIFDRLEGEFQQPDNYDQNYFITWFPEWARSFFGFDNRSIALLPSEHLPVLRQGVTEVSESRARLQDLCAQIRQDGSAIRNAEAKKILQSMPIERLKEAAEGRLSLAPLHEFGITFVQQVLDNEYELDAIPGIGDVMSTRITGAAHTLETMTNDEVVIRPKADDHSPAMTLVLRRAYEAVRLKRALLTTLGSDIQPSNIENVVISAQPQGAAVLIVAKTEQKLDALWDQADNLLSLAEDCRSIIEESGRIVDTDLWRDYSAQPTVYLKLLESLGFNVEDQEAIAGGLPEEVVARVRAQELDLSLVKHSIRGYQMFASRFALAQRKVIIGDDMGIGKTVEALTVLAHLWARRLKGSPDPLFLVICPAAVVLNWLREARQWVDVPILKLHGADRDQAFQQWMRQGGIAVTTYGTVGRFEFQARHPDVVIVDEAHMTKNPEAQRSAITAALVDCAKRAVLLTGTPLENRIDEFMTLAGYVDLKFRSDSWSPKAFRSAVAPVYLRRNQQDVLDELPQLIEKVDIVEMSPEDERLYRRQVFDGNFMGMRQASLLSGKKSAKVTRLIEILHEAQAAHRRTLVFSYFRSVLTSLLGVLQAGGFDVHGVLDGSVTPQKRQKMVDHFSQADPGAVLLSQIEAGGVGMNIQAASVVILCEPQWKPTVESQAIARAHRQRQELTVIVHRLITDVGVDQRMLEVLDKKRALFDAYARRSALAEEAPEAKDASQSEIAAQIITDEQQRYRLQEHT